MLLAVVVVVSSWAGLTCLWLMYMDGLRYSPSGLPWWFAFPKVLFAVAFFASQAMLQVRNCGSGGDGVAL